MSSEHSLGKARKANCRQRWKNFGDPLRIDSYTDKIPPADTFVHLIGTPHPSPAKAKQFQEIDLVSIQVAAKAAGEAGVRHFVYLSVAHPASMMQAFIAVRRQGRSVAARNRCSSHIR